MTYIQNIAAFIERLGATYKLGIVTNTHHAPLIWHHLNAMGIANAFRTVVISVEHGRPKPHRAIFEYAIRALGPAPSEALLEVLLGELEPVIGPWHDMLERVVTTDWTGDAYAGGGWSVYPLPSNDACRTILIQPHGCCFFAGEHLATENGATMEGALGSGHAAAQMLLAQLAG